MYSSLQIVANLTGCDRGTTEELVRCMREKSQEELVDATKRVNGHVMIYASLHQAGVTDAFDYV